MQCIEELWITPQWNKFIFIFSGYSNSQLIRLSRLNHFADLKSQNKNDVKTFVQKKMEFYAP